MHSHPKLSGWILGATLTVAALLGIPRESCGQVSVVPADTSVATGDGVFLRIVTGPVADLKAFTMIFEYDPAILQLIGILPGDVLTSAGSYTAFALDDHTAPADSAWFDAGILSGSGSGPGILAFLHFQAISPLDGVSPIACRLMDFRDSQNVSTQPACGDGIVRVFGPVQAQSGTWGRIKSLYR